MDKAVDYAREQGRGTASSPSAAGRSIDTAKAVNLLTTDPAS